MPADRFYVPSALKKSDHVLIEGPEYHHLTHVMRIAAGEEIELVNGKGVLAIGKFEEGNKKAARVKILSVSCEMEPERRFFLAVSLMRPAKLEWIVEKGTELGASGFFFFSSKHSEKAEISSRHLERLHLLSISSLKQSGRLYLPTLEIHSGLEPVLAKEGTLLFGKLGSAPSLQKLPIRSPSIFITGPEKGFSEEELSRLQTSAQGVSLSRYTLRAETAPIAAASLLGTFQIEI